jgi:hypothetical protein
MAFLVLSVPCREPLHGALRSRNRSNGRSGAGFWKSAGHGGAQ